MQTALSASLPPSPFVRLRALLNDIPPGKPPVSLALGEPQHAPPDFVLAKLAAAGDDYRRYPPIAGSNEWQAAVRDWLSRRLNVTDGLAAGAVLPLNGTREGLFLAAQLAPEKADGLVAMPDPFYQVYAAAALAIGATPHYLPATKATGFLPDLTAMSDATLARLRALYLCTPANPQGVVADAAYLKSALALAEKHDFFLLVDECYGEIYDAAGGAAPPPSMLQIMQAQKAVNAPVLVFHSLSKRSNLPGLRSGFVAGGDAVMQDFTALRQLAGPQSPLPAQAAAALAWADDAHVEKNRALYGAKFDAAENILTGRFEFYRPAAGFFLWLNVGDGEAAAVKLWREEGLRVLPGAYLAGGDSALAAPYIRVALVASLAETEDALRRLTDCLERGDAQHVGDTKSPTKSRQTGTVQ